MNYFLSPEIKEMRARVNQLTDELKSRLLTRNPASVVYNRQQERASGRRKAKLFSGQKRRLTAGKPLVRLSCFIGQKGLTNFVREVEKLNRKALNLASKAWIFYSSFNERLKVQ
jgi:hypothetical protein